VSKVATVGLTETAAKSPQMKPLLTLNRMVDWIELARFSLLCAIGVVSPDIPLYQAEAVGIRCSAASTMSLG
jgi:hypothetical protein